MVAFGNKGPIRILRSNSLPLGGTCRQVLPISDASTLSRIEKGEDLLFRELSQLLVFGICLWKRSTNRLIIVAIKTSMLEILPLPSSYRCPMKSNIFDDHEITT